MTTSVPSWIVGSGTCSTRMSFGPCQVTARMPTGTSGARRAIHPQGWFSTGYLLAMDAPTPGPGMIPATPLREHDFSGLRIQYDDEVLAPRDWTAEQSRWAAELIREAGPGPVLELCAGVGHIGLLAVHLVPRPLVCVDANPVA